MKQMFDFIVVGAGTAGCTLAARLSEDSESTVLLIEAGGDDRRPDVTDPTRWAEIQRTDADWSFESTLQRGTGYVHPVPRGKVLGGSGSINNMTHLRGDPQDFEQWSCRGAIGWDYAGVLPYFMRSEHVPDGDTYYRGIDGPLHPQRNRVKHPAGASFADAAMSVGHKPIEDFNAGDLIGVGFAEALINAGKRQSTATAYLRPAMERPNLSVATEHMVLRLVMRGDRCTGVEISGPDGISTRSAGEVVLCAGAVGSAQLLQISGIGPSSVLEPAGVSVKHELTGVGEDLQDHILVAGIRVLPDREVVRGRLGGQGATVFLKLDDSAFGPDCQFMLLGFDYHTPHQEPAPNALTLLLGQMRPFGRGSVRITSCDLSDQPLIDLGFLADDRDMPRLIEGLERLDEIVRAGALDEWGQSDTSRLLAMDQGDLEREIRMGVSSYFHLAGSCRMGQDSGAVVDADLRVHGIDGLRVADTSVMPLIVSTNTNAAAVMIGEKAADLIRGKSLRANLDQPIKSL